jgi:hypothetical protein
VEREGHEVGGSPRTQLFASEKARSLSCKINNNPEVCKVFFWPIGIHTLSWPIRILVLLASRLCYSKHLLIHTFPATADAAAAVSSQVHYLIILLLEFLKIPCSREARVRLTPLFSAERLLTQTFIPEVID